MTSVITSYSIHYTKLYEPPRSGRSTIAAQVAAGAPGGGRLVDARKPEGRAVLADPASASAARLIVVDGAGRLEAERA